MEGNGRWETGKIPINLTFAVKKSVTAQLSLNPDESRFLCIDGT